MKLLIEHGFNGIANAVRLLMNSAMQIERSRPLNAGLYIQGVSTRKATRITEELYGFKISSPEVSRAGQILEKHLQA